MTVKPKTYSGDDFDIHFQANICIHAAECGKRLSVVFDVKNRPWVNPNGASKEAIIKTIDACPSGALTITDKEGKSLLPATQNTATIIADGPVVMQGNITLKHRDQETKLRRISLCRCGKSKNKPYCDGAHKEGFSNNGHLHPAESKAIDTLPDQSLDITVKNSLVINGSITVKGADGLTRTSDMVALCRCGHSQTMPWCDGAHKTLPADWKD